METFIIRELCNHVACSLTRYNVIAHTAHRSTQYDTNEIGSTLFSQFVRCLHHFVAHDTQIHDVKSAFNLISFEIHVEIYYE